MRKDWDTLWGHLTAFMGQFFYITMAIARSCKGKSMESLSGKCANREAAVTGVHRITHWDTTAWKVFITHWPYWLYEYFSHREKKRNYQNYLVGFSICTSRGQTCSVMCPQTFNHPVPRPPHSKSGSTHNSMLNL